jgi:2-amino-4-hydroxy-6-hydroxymethyldihydropteridine diphosphokinase
MLTDYSKIYETEPWGFADQPAFLNQVVAGNTSLKPLELLGFTQSIEKGLGRVKTFRNGPRVIDIDILLYGEQIVETESLTIPHPRLHERGFVLKPLADIAPKLRVPGFDLCVAEMLASVDQAGIKLWSPLKKDTGV